MSVLCTALWLLVLGLLVVASTLTTWEQLQFAGKYFTVDQGVLNYLPQHADRVSPPFASVGRW